MATSAKRKRNPGSDGPGERPVVKRSHVRDGVIVRPHTAIDFTAVRAEDVPAVLRALQTECPVFFPGPADHLRHRRQYMEAIAIDEEVAIKAEVAIKEEEARRPATAAAAAAAERRDRVIKARTLRRDRALEAIRSFDWVLTDLAAISNHEHRKHVENILVNLIVGMNYAASAQLKGLEPQIRTGEKQRRARVKGMAALHAKVSPRHANWQQKAAGIWAREPNLSKRAVAMLIDKTKSDLIRRVIIKPEK